MNEQEQAQPAVEEVRPAPPKAEVMLIPLGEGGKVAARNNAELMRYCGALVSGGGVPARFDTPQKLFAALMYVRELGLPDVSIRQVANIHGTVSIFGDLPLALAQRTGKLTHIKEQWFDERYDVICFENKNLDSIPMGAVCWLARDGAEPQSFAFTMGDAERAGLYPAKNPATPWAKYTKLMLRYKARSIALKSLFADAVNGVQIAEYDLDVLPDASGPDLKDVTPPGTDIRSAFREQIEENA